LKKNKKFNLENIQVLGILILKCKISKSFMINGNLLTLLRISVGQINIILNKLKIDMLEDKWKNKIRQKE
jgi:hypothetical protein